VDWTNLAATLAVTGSGSLVLAKYCEVAGIFCRTGSGQWAEPAAVPQPGLAHTNYNALGSYDERSSMSSVPTRLLTEAEYLACERNADFRSEFYRGETFAMAGASREHNLIAANITRALGNQLSGGPCEVYQSDMKVQVSATGLYTYPDVVVACGGPQFADDKKDVLLNPTLIVEVLSPATAGYDCGPKAAHYRRLDSLQEFVLVDQNTPVIEHYGRESSDTWRISRHEGLASVLALNSIGCRLLLADCYTKVEFVPGAATLLLRSPNIIS
jgi:Uma2 family endonuclease